MNRPNSLPNTKPGILQTEVKKMRVYLDKEEWRKQQQRHPDSQMLHNLICEIGELHDKKQADYGLDSNPFHNIDGAREWGIRPWVGALLRATDKIRRLQKFARAGELANESVEDSFKDLAVYALIGLVKYRREQEGKNG